MLHQHIYANLHLYEALLKKFNVQFAFLDNMCSAPKRFKAMSPNSMTLPTTSTWEMGQGLSPYSALPPDMQSKYNFFSKGEGNNMIDLICDFYLN